MWAIYRERSSILTYFSRRLNYDLVLTSYALMKTYLSVEFFYVERIEYLNYRCGWRLHGNVGIVLHATFLVRGRWIIDQTDFCFAKSLSVRWSFFESLPIKKKVSISSKNARAREPYLILLLILPNRKYLLIQKVFGGQRAESQDVSQGHVAVLFIALLVSKGLESWGYFFEQFVQELLLLLDVDELLHSSLVFLSWRYHICNSFGFLSRLLYGNLINYRCFDNWFSSLICNLVFLLFGTRLPSLSGELLGMLNEPLGPFPLDLVLDCLLDEADAFEDIGDVINSSFLDIKFDGGLVQINFSGLWGLNQGDEFLSQLSETIV